jgi:hypothetical protein
VRLKSLGNAAAKAFLATAVFAGATYAVEQIGWSDPLGLAQQATFFVIFFLGMLLFGKV